MKKLIAQNVDFKFSANAPLTLKNISLELEKGQLTSVVGTSGCGKTSLLNILASFLRPTSGKVLLDQHVLTQPDAQRSVVFQDHTLLPWLNVQDNIAFSLKLKNQKDHTKVQSILKTMKLTDVASHAIWQLSGGMKQRVGIARAIISDASFLLLDEPFAALDAFTKEKMQHLILDLWIKEKKGFFLITHDIEEALLLSQQLVIMKPYPGRIDRTLSLDFSKRYASGESIRHIKSSPDFIELRDYLFNELSHTGMRGENE